MVSPGSIGQPDSTQSDSGPAPSGDLGSVSDFQPSGCKRIALGLPAIA